MKHFDFRPASIAKRLCIAYVAICAFMWFFQGHIIFVPSGYAGTPEEAGLTHTEALRLKASDGVSIAAWYHPAAEGYPTIVHFHGNGGTLSGRGRYFRLLTEQGFGLLAIDYRGYGTSEGSPTEEGVYMDARAAMDYATRTLSIPPERLIIYGESLGTAVATQMATEYQSGALVLQSPFTSMEAMAEESYGWLPVRLILKYRFDSLAKIPNIHTPLLLFHGEQDNIVPISLARQLFAAAPMPKESVYFPDKAHNNLDIVKMDDALTTFCRKQGLLER